MFAEERQNQIVALVNKNGSVRVKELSEKYQVTEDSIRKDLTFLEKKGLLKKTYGGAMISCSGMEYKAELGLYPVKVNPCSWYLRVPGRIPA